MIKNNTNIIPLFVFTSWLEQSKRIDNTSSIFMIISMALLFFPNQPLVLGIVFSLFLVSIVEKYYAFRVSFDNELFKQLMHDEDRSLTNALDTMDIGLAQLKLIKNNKNIQRSLLNRQQGTLGLFKKQCCFCMMQLALFIVLFATYLCY